MLIIIDISSISCTMNSMYNDFMHKEGLMHIEKHTQKDNDNEFIQYYKILHIIQFK